MRADLTPEEKAALLMGEPEGKKSDGFLLRQDEIDQLLSGISDKDPSFYDFDIPDTRDKIKIFDFRRPPRISGKEKFQFSQILTSYLNVLNAHFNKFFGNDTYTYEFTFTTDENKIYCTEDIQRGLASNDVLVIGTTDPFKNKIALEISKELAHTLINARLSYDKLDEHFRGSLTDIDISILEENMVHFLSCLREAFSFTDIRPRVEKISTKGTAILECSSDPYDSHLAKEINLNIQYKNSSYANGQFVIYFPSQFVKKMLSVINKSQDQSIVIPDSTITCTVELQDSIEVELKELVNLRRGFEFELDKKIGLYARNL